MKLRVDAEPVQVSVGGSPDVLYRIEDFLAPFSTSIEEENSSSADFTVKKRDDVAALLRGGDLEYSRPYPGGFMVRFEKTFTRSYVRKISRREGVLLHAAAVRLNEEIFVFCGESNDGKTTSVQIFLPRADTFLSDEFVYIDFDQSRIYPFPRPINAKSPSQNEDFFRWVSYRNRLDQRYHYGYPPREFYPPRTSSGNLHFVFLAKNDSSSGGVSKIPVGEGISRLLASNYKSEQTKPMSTIRAMKDASISFRSLSWGTVDQLTEGLFEITS